MKIHPVGTTPDMVMLIATFRYLCERAQKFLQRKNECSFGARVCQADEIC